MRVGGERERETETRGNKSGFKGLAWEETDLSAFWDSFLCQVITFPGCRSYGNPVNINEHKSGEDTLA